MKLILITGANGFIGKSVIHHFSGKGYALRAMVRNKTDIIGDGSVEVYEGNMKDYDSLLRATKDIYSIIHLAAAKSDEQDSYEVNVEGAEKLIKAAKSNNVTSIINISSASTKIEQKGVYASTKSMADKVFMESGLHVTTLKPSVVYGDDMNGVFKSIMKYASLPITPVIGTGESTFYPIHVEDLCIVIEKAISKESTENRYYDVGGPDQISFNNLIKKTAKIVLGKSNIILFHIPTEIGLFLAKILSSFMKKPPFSKSNILGSTQHIEFNIHPCIEEFGFTPRSIEQGLMDFATKETYQKEAVLMYNYMLPGRNNITAEEISRYYEILDINHVGLSQFSHIVYRFPFLLGGLDAISRLVYPKSTLQKKILIIATLTETSSRSASWLLPKKRSIFHIIIRGIYLGIKALLKILLGLILLLLPSFVQKNVA